MNSRKETLKKLIKFAPTERRIQLENFVDNDLLDENLEDCISYVEQLNGNRQDHSIIDMGYSDSGEFYVKTETGMTFLKK